jgi:hypothetical protein
MQQGVLWVQAMGAEAMAAATMLQKKKSIALEVLLESKAVGRTVAIINLHQTGL